MNDEAPAVLKIDVISLFPETIMSALSASIPARALERGLATLTLSRSAYLGDREAPLG